MAIALALSILLFVAGRFGLLGPASIGLPVALLAVFTGCAVALTYRPAVRFACSLRLGALGFERVGDHFGQPLLRLLLRCCPVAVSV